MPPPPPPRPPPSPSLPLPLSCSPYVQKSGGVQYVDSVYVPLAQALGLDASTGMPILGDYSNKTWVTTFFSIAVKRLLVDLDVDFAWPDWQQGEWTRMLGLPPTPWLSYLFASAPHFLRAASLAPPVQPRPAALPALPASSFSARSMVLNRWGGLGAHRYPVGFSGDAETTWEVLKLQVFITATAANVAFQWSHDIGGFAGSPEPELMTRWVQLGVFSPVLRPHCAGRGGNSRDIWRFEWPAFEIMRDFFRARARLVPYLATAQREAYESGVVPVHPLYYDFPTAASAFSEGSLHQYSFGDAIWVAPITAPASKEPLEAGLAQTTVWFPPGTWIEWFSWQAHSAPGPEGASYDRRFGLEEMPLFSPPGAIIPLRTLASGSGGAGEQGGSAVGTAVEVPKALTLWVFPPAGTELSSKGSFSSTARIYDDDGVSMAYASQGGSSGFLWTNVSCSWRRQGSVDSVSCSISPGGGSGFPEMPSARSWTLRFISAWPPAAVAVNGQPAALSASSVPADAVWGDGAAWPQSGAPAYAYSGTGASVWVHSGAPSPVACGGAAGAGSLTFELTFAPGSRADDALLTSAVARKISRAQAAKTAMNLVSWSAHPADVPRLLAAAGAGAKIEDAVAAAAELEQAEAGAGSSSSRQARATALAARVRSEYEALSGHLGEAREELRRLSADHGVDGPAVDTMRGLINNALS